MHKLYYQPEGFWFGDCMPFGKDGKFYLYHQRDTRVPAPFGEPFGWDLATTSDFVSYEDCGVAIPRGSDEVQDQFIYAGSVFEAEGVYHAFYTGFNRDYPALGKPSQVLMHAVSTDLLNWVKTEDALKFSPQPGYDPTDWRDPFVLWDDEENRYLLILGARLDGVKSQTTGRTVYFTSDDLQNWEFHGDFWAPDMFTMHEMPDLFKIGDWWYLITTEYSDRSKMIYRMSKSLKGPWIAPKDDAFDGRAYYAGRTFCLDGQRILFGWVPSRENEKNSAELVYNAESDGKKFIWGGTSVAHEVYQRDDASLGVKAPDTVWDAFNAPKAVPDVKIASADTRKYSILARDCGDLFRFEADVRFSENTKEFGVTFMQDEDSQETYMFTFHLDESRLVFEKKPNRPWPQLMNIGLERPIWFEAGKTYNIRMIVDDTIATIYVDGVALNARFYLKPGGSLGMFVTNGELEITNASVAIGLKK